MKLERLREILARAAGKRILVIGDLMLDEFVWGKVGRISPEAPVPVVEVTGRIVLSGRRRERRAQSARIHRRRFGHRNGRDGRQRPATARAAARAKNRHRPRPGGSGFPHDREDADHRASPAGGAGRSRTISRAEPPRRSSKSRARSARRVCRKLDAIIFEDYGKGFLSAELVRQISAEAERCRQNRDRRSESHARRSRGRASQR